MQGEGRIVERDEFDAVDPGEGRSHGHLMVGARAGDEQTPGVAVARRATYVGTETGHGSDEVRERVGVSPRLDVQREARRRSGRCRWVPGFA
ncbi:MAG: hypothetical protein ACPHJ1_04405 [Ilumatobacteraceae bacterium]